MIEYAGAEFRLPAAGEFKQAVINDKSIDAVLVRERFDGISHLLG